MTSLFMWAESSAEGGPLNSRGWKVRKQVCYKNCTSSLFSHLHTHTHTQTAARVWTAGMRAVTHRHAQNICTRVHTHGCTDTHTHTNHRVNSCGLTSRRCQHDGGEEKRRSKENREREERGGGVMLCWESAAQCASPTVSWSLDSQGWIYKQLRSISQSFQKASWISSHFGQTPSNQLYRTFTLSITSMLFLLKYQLTTECLVFSSNALKESKSS